jgi:hypothetical protein
MTESSRGTQRKFMVIILHSHTHKRCVGIGAEFITALCKGKGIQRNQIVDIRQNTGAFGAEGFGS